MPDVTITTAAHFKNNSYSRPLMVPVSASISYFFFLASNRTLQYVKTTNGGATWGDPVMVRTSAIAATVWYDRWTPGHQGTGIHIWYGDMVTDDLYYRRLETGEDTLSSEVTIFDGTTISETYNTVLSGARMRGGNLYICMQSSSHHILYRSTNGGSSWAVRSSPMSGEGQSGLGDRVLVLPGNETDSNDCWILYQDVSANALTLKMHDDSANTNTESSTIATVIADPVHNQEQFSFAAAIRHSDGHMILTVATEYDTATGDHRVFDINGLTSITEKTAIATNKSDHYYPGVFIDQFSDDIYVAYIGKRDGTQALRSSATPCYSRSTDGGTTWQAEVIYGAAAGNWWHVWSPPMGRRFMFAFQDSSTNVIRTNHENSVVFSGLSQISGAGALKFTGSLLKPTLATRITATAAPRFTTAATIKDAGGLSPIAGSALINFRPEDVDLRDGTLPPEVIPPPTPTAQRVVLVQIDQPFCQLTYSESPCEAAIGVTGTRRCFNTRVTCQDPANYSPS